MLNKLKLRRKMFLMIGVTSLLVLTAIIALTGIGAQQLIKDKIEEQMLAEANNLSHEIDAYFNRIGQIPVTVASMDAALLNQADHTAQLLAQTSHVLENDPDILNIYNAYEKGVVDGRDYFIAGWIYQNDRQQITRSTANLPGTKYYDPSQPIYEYHRDETWYALAKREGRLVWGPPYYDESGTNQHVVSAASPIYSGGQFVGVAGVDITLEHLNQIIADKKIGERQGMPLS